MINTRNQLDKIIITAMDRFVWFVLLVVISHLVTEFTRATGYTRGPRQDLVTVNDSSTQPIKVQNLVLYPGQEDGHYEQQRQQYYRVNNPNNNYANKNTTNNNFLSSLFNQFTRNQQKGQKEKEPMPNRDHSSNLFNMSPDQKGPGNTFNLRPFIDSIFEIPISTLRAINNFIIRLTAGTQQPAQQHQHQQQQYLEEPTKYVLYPFYPSSYIYYGMHRSLNANTIRPKSQFEMLNRTFTGAVEKQIAESTITPIAKSSRSGSVQR